MSADELDALAGELPPPEADAPPQGDDASPEADAAWSVMLAQLCNLVFAAWEVTPLSEAEARALGDATSNLFAAYGLPKMPRKVEAALVFAVVAVGTVGPRVQMRRANLAAARAKDVTPEKDGATGLEDVGDGTARPEDAPKENEPEGAPGAAD